VERDGISLSENNAWFALHVKPRRERVVSELLRAKGYQEFLPTHKIRRERSDRVLELEKVLFPGYIFCKFAFNDKLSVVTTPGVRAIVSVGKTPISMPQEDIDAIGAAIASGLNLTPGPYLDIGSRVLIEEGPFRGVSGIVLKHNEGCTLVIGVSLLRRSVSIEMPSEWLARAQLQTAFRDEFGKLNRAEDDMVRR
jgi:transcription antitermination factor NusG